MPGSAVHHQPEGPLPRRADLTADGYARLSYRQADTRWKRSTPGWDLHQLRHTAITVRAAQWLHGGRTQALQRAPVSAQPRGLYRCQSRGRQAQGTRVGTRQPRQPTLSANRLIPVFCSIEGIS